MEKQQLIEKLQEDCLDTDNVFFSVTTAKGLITLFWSVTFLDTTHTKIFNELLPEINWANMKLDYLSKKYPQFYKYSKKLTEADAMHFDFIALTQKKTPVKRAYKTNTYSMGGFIQFNFPGSADYRVENAHKRK